MAGRELEAAVRRSDGIPVVDLVGDIDANAEVALQAAWDEAAPGATAVILDFSRTSYINSTGIALIVQLLANARARGIGFTGGGLSWHYQTVMAMRRTSD